MPEYRVLRGTFRPADDDDRRCERGDTFVMSEERRADWPDEKFDLVEEKPDHRENAPLIGDADPDVPEASADLPADWHVLRSMAIVADTDDINGSSNKNQIRDHLEDYDPGELAQIRQQAESRLED